MASGDSLLQWSAFHAEPASTGVLNVRNGHPLFDLETGDTMVLSGIMPQHYDGGGVTVLIHYAMDAATSGNVEFTTAFERVGDGQQDIDSDGFASGQDSGDVAVPGTSGHIDIATVSHTNGAQMDSLSKGEGFRLEIERTAPSTSDASGSSEIRWIELRET